MIICFSRSLMIRMKKGMGQTVMLQHLLRRLSLKAMKPGLSHSCYSRIPI